MNNILLKSLRVKNFGPFAEEICFTTEIDMSKKEPVSSTISVDSEEFNRISYIYGANGAGKSNFCKAIIQIQNFINLSPILAANNPQLLELQPIKLNADQMDRRFLFDVNKRDASSEYEIGIILDGTTYQYAFSVLEGRIVSEKLTRKKQRTETILLRTSPEYKSIELKSELASFSPNVSVVKERALCLSMAAFLNNPLASTIVEAISRITVVNMANLNALRNIEKKDFTESIRQRCLKLLHLADPTMEDFSVEFTEEEVEKRRVPVPIDDLEGRELIIKNIRVDVQSTHTVYEDTVAVEKVSLPFLKIESSGTIKMLGILPHLFSALENGCPIVIDELENGLHPTLVQMIVEMFNSPETNPNGSQLICTTHSMLLAERNVRRDQVWVISKNEYGQSTIKRISDYPGTRSTDNIAEKYLLRAFGSIPKFS